MGPPWGLPCLVLMHTSACQGYVASHLQTVCVQRTETPKNLLVAAYRV